MGLPQQTLVNIGTLDHFAGMIGTGNTAPGGVTLSTGTVMALAVMAREPAVRDCGIALHFGFAGHPRHAARGGNPAASVWSGSGGRAWAIHPMRR